MDSQHTGRSYQITINLPLAYAHKSGGAWPFNDVPDKWPVVYVVDGNWYTGMMTDIVRPMSWAGDVSDAIIVGIGYPSPEDGADAWRDAFIRRDADLLPFRDEALEQRHSGLQGRPCRTGDGGNFLRFISDELIPTIEREFNADPDWRILIGHSYGGIFGAYALFEAPTLFRSLVVGSPSLHLGDRAIFAYEEAYAKENKSLPANLYLYAGELEESAGDPTFTNTLRLAAILRSRQYDDLNLTQHILVDHDHFDTIAPGARWGLKLALKK
jgi:predicted alpha/beta superfamily hydrolase